MPNIKGTKHYKTHIPKFCVVDRGYSKKIWQSSKHSIFDQEKMDWLINNDLPLNEEFEKLGNKYERNGEKNL